MNIEKINQWFAQAGKWIVKRRWIVIGIFVLMIGVTFNGLRNMNVTSSWNDYFLEDDPMIIKSDEFKEVFGNDNFTAVLTKCENTFTKENLELIRELSNEIKDSLSYAEKVTSITDIEFMVGNEDGMTIEQIVPEEIPTDNVSLEKIRQKAYIKPYIADRLISKDGRLTWIVVKLRKFPEESEWNKTGGVVSPEILTGKELDHIISKEKYKTLSPKGTGLPYVTEMKMRWINKEMPRIMAIANIASIIVLLLITSSVRGVIVPPLTATSAILITYGVLGYLRFSIDSGMMMIPMLLTFAVAIAYNIHIYSFFNRRFKTHGKRKKAVEETVSEMGWPILFSALTTFAALLSFLAIPMKPMRFVGIASSMCIIFSFLIAITIMPVLLSFGKDRQPNEKVIKQGGMWIDKILERFGEKVIKHGILILTSTSILLVILIYGFTKIETAFDVERTMGKKIEYVKDLLEVGKSELGSIYSYDVMIDLPEEGMAKSPQSLIKLDSLAQYASKLSLTKRSTSLLNIIKDLNQTIHEGNKQHYTVPNNSEEIAQLLLLYENAGGAEAEYWIDYEYRRLRLMVEMNDYNSGKTEKELEEIVSYAQKLYPNATITTVGSIPQFTMMMQYVTRGQIMSFVIAIIVIGMLMMMVFGSVKIGLIGLIPNITPAIVVGGLMGFMNYPLDMMTATIMPMILGLAVDDTIHFINHGRLEFMQVRNYKEAVLRSFRVVGAPLVLTSIIISTNFLTYVTSDGSSFIRMGILSVAGIMSALIADLCITPVLFNKFKIFGKEII